LEPSTTTRGPAEQPASSATNRQLELQRRRALIIHTRLAQFFTWILLLGFVILPGTFSRVQGGGSGNGLIDQIANLPLYVLPFPYLPFLKCLLSVVFHRWSDFTCGNQPIDSQSVTSAVPSTDAQFVGSGISGRMTRNGSTSTFSPPGWSMPSPG
jgi:hypothetical protein